MSSPFPPFAALALHPGNSRNLQMVGVGDDGALYLAAWQSHASGAWTVPDTNALAFQTGTFSAVALASGNSDRLQVLGLGADQQIYLAAWQYEDGTWIEPIPENAGPMGDPARHYTAVAAGRGAGYLNVFGLGTDGRIYVVATQDDAGHWRADNRILSTPGISYAAMVVVTDAQGWLQLLGLGTDGRAYWVAWLSDGWSVRGEPIGNPKHRYTALAAARGNGHNLQVMGLGTDRKIYLVAWQDEKQAWHISTKYGGPLGNESRPYATVAAHTGGDGNLQIVSLGTDGKAYLPVWQDKDGQWHAPSQKNAGPLGDPALTYRAQALASGKGSDAKHPGDLQVVGLGAAENDDGLAYVATWQDRDGHWHSSQPLGKARSPIVNWEAPTGQTVDGGCLAFGQFWVTQGSSVRSFDIISGVPGRKLSGFGSNASPRFVQPHGDRLAVACDDGRVYAADPDTGAIGVLATVGVPSWMAASEGALYVAGDGVVRIGPDGAVSHPYGQGTLGGDPAVAGGAVYVPISSSSLGSSVDVLDAGTMARLWSAGADGRPGPVFCDGSRLCFTTWHKSLFVYDVGSRAPITPHGKPIGLAAETDILPIFNNGLCYVALGGAVQAIDAKTGKPRRSFAPVRNPVGPPVLNAGGVLFYSSANGISMIDTAAASAGVVTYATGGSPLLAAYQDGALFYADSGNAAAVRLDEAIHQYYAETNLIRDFDFSNGVGAAASTPNFQVEIALFDKDGSPRAGQPVRLTATAPTTLAYQGRRMRVSRTESVDVETDGAGRLRVAVDAGTIGRDGGLQPGLTAPELLLTSPFMDRRMRLVIRPSGQLQGQLASIEKTQLKDATGYDGKAVLTDTYRGSDKRLTAATGAINQASGMVHASMGDARKRDAGNMYCDSACDMAVACCMPASDPGCRVVCDQSFSFDLTEDRAHFRLLSVAEAEAAMAGLAGEAGQLGDWGDLWDDIKSGAAKVTGAVVTAVAAGAHAVITTLQGTFTGLIDTIEQAALLVQGVFNEIATAIHRVVEAVSFLFDWEAILDLHDQIRQQIEDAWTALTTGSGGVSLAAIKAAIGAKLDAAKDKADAAFGDAKAKFGGQTLLGVQSDVSGRANSAVGSSQDNWLLAKMQDNVIAPTVSGSPAGAAAAQISWPTFDPGDQVSAIFTRFLDTLGDKLTADARATIDRVREDLDFRSNSSVLARGLSAVIDILRGLVDIAIDIGQAVIDLLIDLLAALIDAARGFVAHDIEIPYLSDLYHWATGRKLSLLDLFALIIAIPAGFGMRLMSREPAYASGVSPLQPAWTIGAPRRRDVGTPLPVGWITIVAGCAQAVWAPISGILGAAALWRADKSGYAPPGSRTPLDWARLGLTLTALIVVRGAFGAAILVHQLEVDLLVWSIWLVPTLAMLGDVAALTFRGLGSADAADVFAMLCGIVLMGLAAYQFYEGKKTVGDGLALGFGLAVGISLACRVKVFIPDVKVAIALVAVGALALFASGVIEFARGLVGSGREAVAS
ncbi:hypothetical protein [Inquilinus sp.]|jgi:hypothetical protein|uniref:hypothetical protein n=1 Tax=Inquilinus sp. TaxID=1932117 RepID=UPI0037840F22